MIIGFLVTFIIAFLIGRFIRSMNDIHNIGIYNLKRTLFELRLKNKSPIYNEEQVLKAVEYACNYQKACDYQDAGHSLLEDFDTVEEANLAIIHTLDVLSNTNLNNASEITINEINEYLERT